MTFEENIEKLSAIVKELESGKLPLDKALDRYKEGVDLSVQARKQLEEAKQTVRIMNGASEEDKDD